MTFRALGGLRLHLPSLVVLVFGGVLSLAAFFWMRSRADAERQGVFNREATLVVSNLRSALERPLEVLEASATLFEASQEVTRKEFANFVVPALDRHPGVRALEWIPIVPRAERQRFEEQARADGLSGFEFRERGANGSMVRARERETYMPIYFMEPGHPVVLGFDCASDSERLGTAEHARQTGAAVASERIQLLDDPPSVYSIVTFRPVHDPRRPRAPDTVLGFTCEVFRVRAVAERAIDESLKRGIEVGLFDPAAPPEKQLLFESSDAVAVGESSGPRFESALKYADREWRLVLTAGPGYGSNLSNSASMVLLLGLTGTGLFASIISAIRVVSRLKNQVQRARELGQYTLLERLGEGGGGVVHKAQHAFLRRPTAIKLLHDARTDARALARFEREAQLTSELTHPNIIAIYDYGQTPEGVLYYAMEYIDGTNLQDLVERDGPLGTGRVVQLLKQICSALSEAHEVGLIHRDIKPSNLMVCQRGGVSDFVKVMDFGLVKRLTTGVSASAITEVAAQAFVGTPLYLPPESLGEEREVDARSDLYSLGAVAYFLVVGEPVFTGSSVFEVCTHHLNTAPVPPSERSGRPLPAELEQIILRCLAKSPDERYQSAAELHAALSQVPGLEPWTEQDAHDWWRRWRERDFGTRSA